MHALRRELFRNVFCGMLTLDPVGFLWVVENWIVIILCFRFFWIIIFYNEHVHVSFLIRKGGHFFNKMIHFHRDSMAGLELELHFLDSLSSLSPHSCVAALSSVSNPKP